MKIAPAFIMVISAATTAETRSVMTARRADARKRYQPISSHKVINVMAALTAKRVTAFDSDFRALLVIARKSAIKPSEER